MPELFEVEEPGGLVSPGLRIRVGLGGPYASLPRSDLPLRGKLAAIARKYVPLVEGDEQWLLLRWARAVQEKKRWVLIETQKDQGQALVVLGTDPGEGGRLMFPKEDREGDVRLLGQVNGDKLILMKSGDPPPAFVVERTGETHGAPRRMRCSYDGQVIHFES